MSIEAYIEELVDPGRALAVSKLTQLSALGPAEAALLATSWPEMELQKRQRLVQGLIDLEEDSIELNFDTVFFLGLADGDAEVRRDSIRGLWENESRDLIDALTDLLADDHDAGVRAEAALALGRFVLQAEFEDVKLAYVETLDQALRGAFQDESEAVEVRGRALESLGARAAPWVRDLIGEAFESPERRLRRSAVHAMGRHCDESWLQSLCAALVDARAPAVLGWAKPVGDADASVAAAALYKYLAGGMRTDEAVAPGRSAFAEAQADHGHVPRLYTHATDPPAPVTTPGPTGGCPEDLLETFVAAVGLEIYDPTCRI